MPPPVRIPVPADNYDAPHSRLIHLTALRACAVGVDAAFDALLASVQHQSGRVDQLLDRAANQQRRTAELLPPNSCSKDGNDNDTVSESLGSDQKKEQQSENTSQNDASRELLEPLRLELAATYDRAIGKEDEHENKEIVKKEIVKNVSVQNFVRDSVSEAVKAVLRSDRDRDDGRAMLSDEWLDRLTAFDEASECASAVESLAIPSLRSQSLPLENELAYYKEATAMASDAATAAARSAAVGSSTARSSTGASSEDDYRDGDDLTVRTGMSGLTLTSRITTGTWNGADGAGGDIGGAAERRRQRQKEQLERKRRQRKRDQAATGSRGAAELGREGMGREAGVAAQGAADIFDRASAVRQQVISGSKPYLADLLHDAYGTECNNNKSKTIGKQTAENLVLFKKQ